MSIVMRVDGTVDTARTALARAVHDLDPGLPLFDVQTVEQGRIEVSRRRIANGRSAPGPGLLRHAAALDTDRPWFGIGGIDLANLDEVMSYGVRRVVVVRAVTEADDPKAAAGVQAEAAACRLVRAPAPPRLARCRARPAGPVRGSARPGVRGARLAVTRSPPGGLRRGGASAVRCGGRWRPPPGRPGPRGPRRVIGRRPASRSASSQVALDHVLARHQRAGLLDDPAQPVDPRPSRSGSPSRPRTTLGLGGEAAASVRATSIVRLPSRRSSPAGLPVSRRVAEHAEDVVAQLEGDAHAAAVLARRAVDPRLRRPAASTRPSRSGCSTEYLPLLKSATRSAPLERALAAAPAPAGRGTARTSARCACGRAPAAAAASDSRRAGRWCATSRRTRSASGCPAGSPRPRRTARPSRASRTRSCSASNRRCAAGMPRRRSLRVHHVVVDERAGLQQLQRGRGGEDRRVVAAAGAAPAPVAEGGAQPLAARQQVRRGRRAAERRRRVV